MTIDNRGGRRARLGGWLGAVWRAGFAPGLLPALALLCASAGALLSVPALAQEGLSSGSNVMDMFRTLPPDQQQQIMQQLGMGGQGGGGLGASQGFSQGGLGSQQQQELLLQSLRRRPREEQENPLVPLFRPDDWVVVEVDVQPLPVRPVDTAALYQQLTSGTNAVPFSQLSPSQLQQIQAAQQQQQQAAQQVSQAPQVQNPAALAALAGVLPPAQGQSILQPQQASLPPGATGAQAVTNVASGMAPAPGSPEALEQQRLQHLADLIRSQDPYQLTRDGVLLLPGFSGIPLAGLTEAQATLRLQVEPALKGLFFRITRLPLKKTGIEGLKPFGYDLFQQQISPFMPMLSAPVPVDYVVGPGDRLQVQLYGNQNRFYTLMVGRDGRVSFPELGPIDVQGERFTQVKQDIESRVARQMIGVKANVSMGEVRTIDVFVLGDAEEPGSYSVSGLSTITSALYAAGGVKKIGSLRSVQLKRQGQLVRELDLYDLLLRGDTRNDARLLPGDVIFIPPVGHTVAIDGEVRRPAIYEIKHETTMSDLVGLAGGLTPNAEPQDVMLTRIDENQRRVVLKVDLNAGSGRRETLRSGDEVRIMRLRPTLDSGVLLQGYVYTPGAMAFRPGMRLTDVLSSVDQLKPDADLHYVLIRRELMPDRRVEVFSANLGAALAAPGGPADIPLAARDRIIVFDLQSGRDRIIQPVLDELRLQSSLGAPTEVVHINGRVKVPGDYPLEPGMKVSDLIRAGGGLTDSAYGVQAELTRYEVVNGSERKTELVPIDLAALRRGDMRSDLKLDPFDELSIKEVSQWTDQQRVVLRGQVRFPGTYTIKEGETLRSVLERAGGLTEFAFPQGSVFTRQELRVREQQELDMLAQRTQTDLAAMALQVTAAGAINGAASNAGSNAVAVGQNLLTQLRATQAVGRLVIDLPRLMREPLGSQYDVVLRNGDQLIVPKYQQEVTVIGEVQSVTSHLWRRQLTLEGYIELSGGMTQHADDGKIYVVRADGSVVPAHPAHFFRVGGSVEIHPGDTIVVPLNTEKLPALPEWQAITAIIYNLAIGAAAVKALGF